MHTYMQTYRHTYIRTHIIHTCICPERKMTWARAASWAGKASAWAPVWRAPAAPLRNSASESPGLLVCQSPWSIGVVHRARDPSFLSPRPLSHLHLCDERVSLSYIHTNIVIYTYKCMHTHTQNTHAHTTQAKLIHARIPPKDLKAFSWGSIHSCAYTCTPMGSKIRPQMRILPFQDKG